MTAADPVTARHATSDDLAVTETLRGLAVSEQEDARGGQLLFNLDEPLRTSDSTHASVVARSDLELFVGVVGGAVVGHGVAEIRQAPNVRACMIVELFVHPDARGIGVASQILALIGDWARANDCSVLESHVLPGNRNAKNFFERVGMVTRKMQVSTQLAD